MPSQLTLFATIVWVLINLNICSAQNTYHVSSTTDSACPSTPCLNFSQYVQNSETYFTSNTTFIFRPGDHIVEGNVFIANVNTLKLIGRYALDGTKARIVCTLQAGSALILHNVSNAKFALLDFVSCGVQGYPFSAMLLNQVYTFQLTNCSFQNSRSTALYVLNSTVVLAGNSFTNNSAQYYSGGAILALHSHIYLQGKNIFAYNSANGGGAIAIVFFSTLNSAGKSVFMSNTATHGGGIFVVNSTAIFTSDSHFVANTAIYGSMIAVENGLLFFSGNQTFRNNFAYHNGGILTGNAQMDMHGQSTFVNNTSQLQAGSSIWGFDCALNITGNIKFISNSALVGAGTLTVVRCNVSFNGNSTFHKNSGLKIGAVSIANSSVIFEGSTLFSNNYAQHLSGTLTIVYSNVTFLGSVAFVGNAANQSGSAAIFASYGTINFNGETTFLKNSGESGAALYLIDVTVKFNGKSLFVNNTAAFQGGALYTVNSQLPFSRDFLFSGNHAGSLGGAIAAANSSLNCITNGNFSEQLSNGRGRTVIGT